jgi:phosphoribosylformylglycinamidine cyclo-ligase
VTSGSQCASSDQSGCGIRQIQSPGATSTTSQPTSLFSPAAAPRTLGVLSPERSYAAAGVSLATAGSVVERIRAAVESTGARGLGSFAGLHPLDGDRLLAASTDGVGTKLVLARRLGRLRVCGADLAAHCINDVATCGADPLVLLDYVAANEVHLDDVAELVDGAAEVCRAAGVALVGGETAELPGIYADGELDFAGTCVGVVRRGDVIDGSTIEAGDVVIGIESAGVHANGFTLVRRVLEDEDYDGEDLLAPTRLYLDAARALRGRAKAFAHVTGGGILGNLERVLPEGRRVEVDWEAWERPPVFEWLARHVDEEELRRVFNHGIGWCAVVPRAEAGETVIGRIA